MHILQLNVVFGFVRYLSLLAILYHGHAGRSGPAPPSRGGPPLPGGDGVVTLDSWRKSQVLFLIYSKKQNCPTN